MTVPPARFVSHMGSKAISMLVDMERVDRVTVGTLRCMESLVDPEDMALVIAEMDESNGKPTGARLKTVVQTILRRRWWIWCILHDAVADQIHETRSVFLPVLCPSMKDVFAFMQ